MSFQSNTKYLRGWFGGSLVARRKGTSAAWLVPVAVALGAGCADANSAEDLPTAQAETLLETDAKGAHLTFVEPEPGHVLVFSETPHGQDNPLADDDVKKMNFVELYEHLTGEAAPSVLTSAYRRSLEVTEPPIADEPSTELATQSAALTATQFQQKHCGGRKICVTNQRSEREWGEYRVSIASGYVNPVGGAVSLQIRHRRVRTWSNDQHHRVRDGVDFYWLYTPPRLVDFRLKVKVHDLQPDTKYHFAMDWS